jgi:predicted membrane channel-forming protein YqfA (hemolysin III family)
MFAYLPTNLLVISRPALEWMYYPVFVVCALAFYWVLVKRAGDEIPRKSLDTLFFVVLGVVSLIWLLSKLAPPLA